MIETKFKQTEIGLIPEDWEIKTTREFADITTGSQNTQDHVDNGKYPFYVRSPKVERINNYIFDTEGVVTAGDGVGTGKTFHYVNGKFGLHQRCYLIYNYLGVSAKYFYWIFSQYFYERIQSMTAKSSVDSVRKEMIADMYIPLPPTITEQERIAKALSDIDNLITSLSNLIEKKRLIKQGAMQQLLTGKTRLPGFDGEWDTKDVISVANRLDNLRIPVAENMRVKGLTPYYGANGIQDYVKGYTHKGEFVLIAEDGANNLKDYPIRFVKGEIWVNNHAHVLQAKNDVITNLFLSYLLKTVDFESNIVGSGRAKLNSETLMNLELRLPNDVLEQDAIANVLLTMDNEIESLEEERDKYIRLKEGMMQKLLTGQIRLVEAKTKQQELPKAKAANVYFKRSVLAAEIADRLCEERTFGHVKMEKLIFLTEHLCHIDIDSHYHRDAAGPYDNRALRSIDSQLKKQKWFEAKKEDKGYQYIPLQNRGGHKKYFEKYYADVMPMFEKIIDTFKSSPTEQCEIVATLYSAWDDLLQSHQPFTDDDILNEVLNNWHESKKRISRNRWQTELDWMHSNGFVPQENN